MGKSEFSIYKVKKTEIKVLKVHNKYNLGK